MVCFRGYNVDKASAQFVALWLDGRGNDMHTCKVPGSALDSWLTEYPSIKGNYGHLLLEQAGVSDGALAALFRPYFESAHLDARTRFHELIGIDLHPDAADEGAHATYPKCLPPSARRGLFGEVMAGMLTEHYQFVGKHTWSVPVFLFREHADVEAYLFALARDSTRIRQVFGRFGSDFLAVAIDAGGSVTRFLAGEAKWRLSLTPGKANELMRGTPSKDALGKTKYAGNGIWNQLNTDKEIPHGIRQLQLLLKELDSEGFAAAILSIDKAIVLKGPTTIDRTNLVLLCGNGGKTREDGAVLVGWEKTPAEYSATHDLQVVEMILKKGEDFIDLIYDSLWDGA
jgi:hypothetical protein